MRIALIKTLSIFFMVFPLLLKADLIDSDLNQELEYALNTPMENHIDALEWLERADRVFDQIRLRNGFEFKNIDTRHIFLKVYSSVTLGILQDLSSGDYSPTDVDKIHHLVTQFAQLYQKGLLTASKDQTTRTVWTIAINKDLQLTQQNPKGLAFLGLWAHIARDLPIALGTSLSPQELYKLKTGYNRLNRFFDLHQEKMSEIIADFGLGLNDKERYVQKWETKALQKTIILLRTSAYNLGMALSLLPAKVPGVKINLRQELIDQIDKTTAQLAEKISGLPMGKALEEILKNSIHLEVQAAVMQKMLYIFSDPLLERSQGQVWKYLL